MSSEVVAFPRPAAIDARETMLSAVGDLHALISLDPVLGSSPSRVYFVFSDQGRARVEASLSHRRPSAPAVATAYALVAYDFCFGLRLFAYAGSKIPPERARQIIARGADLQGDTLRRAALAFRIDADPTTAFDAVALKAAFFPQTDETLTHVFRLAAL